MSHGWVRGLQVWDLKKSVYFLVLFSIIAQLISRSGSDTISNTVLGSQQRLACDRVLVPTCYILKRYAMCSVMIRGTNHTDRTDRAKTDYLIT
jgi:hypothetical protein